MKNIMSCNGCRVLRKGCNKDCTLRPCLEWISSPESQANATLFLAKFYGRAGLINLINASATHHRPAVFKSLIYEACGRIIDPVNGSVGLMTSGNWPRCQAAVEAVFQGAPLMLEVLSNDETSADQGQFPIIPLQRCDIRHLSKSTAASLHRVRSRKIMKRSKSQIDSLAIEFRGESEAKFTITGWEFGKVENGFRYDSDRAPSHDSFSAELGEPELVNREEDPSWEVKPDPYANSEIELELTLGYSPQLRAYLSRVIEISDSSA